MQVGCLVTGLDNGGGAMCGSPCLTRDLHEGSGACLKVSDGYLHASDAGKLNAALQIRHTGTVIARLPALL